MQMNEGNKPESRSGETYWKETNAKDGRCLSSSKTTRVLAQGHLKCQKHPILLYSSKHFLQITRIFYNPINIEFSHTSPLPGKEKDKIGVWETNPPLSFFCPCCSALASRPTCSEVADTLTALHHTSCPLASGTLILEHSPTCVTGCLHRVFPLSLTE